MKDEKKFKNEEASKLLKTGYDEAKNMLEDKNKVEKFLQTLEKKLKDVPIAGTKLAVIPLMASLVYNYIKKEYTDIPLSSIIAIVSALIYFVSPIDAIPDTIPVLGYVDDAAVIATCWKMVEHDVKKYEKWRKQRNLTTN